MKFKMLLVICLAVIVSQIHSTSAWGESHKKVKLTDIQTLTLRAGQMTTGRRNSPIPQLNCVGGTAAHLFKPQVVQCYNRGSDGYDVQWECKTDMDNAYRFGTVDVVCEGYDYPDDKYILKGSCGLEYTIELTKEGLHTQGTGHHDYYGNDQGQHYGQPSYQKQAQSYKSRSGFGDVIIIAIVCIIIYAIYKTCIQMPTSGADSGTDIPPNGRGTGWFGGGGGGGGWGGSGPAPGFRPEYMPQDDSCSGTRRTSSGSGTGSFWTGAATGGILGYMMGNRANSGTGYAYREPPPAYSSYRAPSPSPFSSGSGSSSSTGTRTASGFGGTKRR